MANLISYEEYTEVNIKKAKERLNEMFLALEKAKADTYDKPEIYIAKRQPTTKSGSNFTFNSNTGQLGATILSGVLAAGTQSNAHTWSAINTYSKPVIGQQVTLTSSSNATAVDLSLSNNFKLTLGENSTLSQPSNEVAGQSGSIIVIQDGSGRRTLAYHSHYKWPAGTVPTLSTAANAVDRIDYIVEAADKVHCVITYDIKV